jgi:hypothetical protein
MIKQLFAKIFTKATPIADISLKARTRLPVTAEEIEKAKEILEHRESYTMPEFKRAYYTVRKYGVEVQKRKMGRPKYDFSDKSLDELMTIAISSKSDYYKKQKACQAIYSLGFRNGKKVSA